MELISPLYHPKNAVKRERKGAFIVYTHRDGTVLAARRAALEKLFRSDWQPTNIIPTKPSVQSFELGGAKVVVRRGIDSYNFIDVYRRAAAARVRLESPIAWVQRGQRATLVSRIHHATLETLHSKFSRSRDEEWKKKMIEKLAYELGKLHGAGVTHRHPHDENVLVTDNGVFLIDLKYMARIKGQERIPTGPTITRMGFVKSETVPRAVAIDLGYLMTTIGKLKIDEQKLSKRYRQGLKLGKQRVKRLKTLRNRI